MAKRKINVLVCDICAEQKSSDDLSQECGLLLHTFQFEHYAGGYGRTREQIYVCTACTEMTVHDLMMAIQDREL